MKQEIKILSVTQAQAFLAKVGAKEVSCSGGAVVYRASNGFSVSAISLPQGKVRLVITAGTCNC